MRALTLKITEMKDTISALREHTEHWVENDIYKQITVSQYDKYQDRGPLRGAWRRGTLLSLQGVVSQPKLGVCILLLGNREVLCTCEGSHYLRGTLFPKWSPFSALPPSLWVSGGRTPHSSYPPSVRDPRKKSSCLSLLLPQFPRHPRSFLGESYDSDVTVRKCMKLREMRHVALAEAGAAEGKESKLSQGKTNKEKRD